MLVNFRGIHREKCGFLILLTATVGVFIYFLYFSQHDTAYATEVNDDLLYFPDNILHFSQEMLDENFDLCFHEPYAARDDNLNSSLKDVFVSFEESTAGKEKHFIRSDPFFKMVIQFADLMSMLNIGTVLIEPSVLFCILCPIHKSQLLRRNFDPKTYMNSKKIMTFGIGEKDALSLEKPEIQAHIKTAGFSIELIQDPLADWMMPSKGSSNTHFTSHVFFVQDSLTVHVVVFYERGSFVWHAKMKSMPYENIPPLEELYFAQLDSAYDSLTAVFPSYTDTALTNISIPSNPQYFLFEISSSKFLECNSSIVESFARLPPSSSTKTRSPKDQQRFKRRTIVALRELKAKLNPLLIQFWIWSGTLLGMYLMDFRIIWIGWYRQCDVIPYTSDVDFGAWAREVDDLNQLVQLFTDDPHLKLKERMGTVEQGLELNLNCYKVRVDLFFLYPQSNGSWYAGHRPSKGYFFKYHHPNFSLCSAELLEHKVLVPCESEEVLSTEYGTNWLEPVTKWNYETSIKNRGPNIYWEKSMLKEAYPSVP